MTKGLAIVGHGKMGKLVEELAPAFDFEIRARLTLGEQRTSQALLAKL